MTITTVFVVDDVAFDDRDQAQEYERLSGNTMRECRVLSPIDGEDFLAEYRDTG